MKTKVRINYTTLSEIISSTGLIFITIFFFAISIKENIIASFFGLGLCITILIFYIKIIKATKNITVIMGQSIKKTKDRLALLNSQRLTWFTASVYSISILMLATSYLHISRFSIVVFLISIILLFFIFFGESINFNISRQYFTRIAYFISICILTSIFLNKQNSEINTICLIIIIGLLVIDFLRTKIFLCKPLNHNEQILYIINRISTWKSASTIIIASVLIYCLVSNNINNPIQFFTLIIILSMAGILIQDILPQKNRILNCDEYFYKNSCYMARKAVAIPLYSEDWIDRNGYKRSKEYFKQI